MPDTEERPVLWGLAALVAVALVIGLVAAVAVLLGTRVLGVGEEIRAGAETTAEDSLYLPKPSSSEESPASPSQSSQTPSQEQSKQAKRQRPITLSAAQSAVGPMEQIDLTGSYPEGEGAILQVQRLEAGTWSDFPVTVSVSGGSFSTFVQTGQPGPNKFRVADTDSDRVSNVVTVTVG